MHKWYIIIFHLTAIWKINCNTPYLLTLIEMNLSGEFNKVFISGGSINITKSLNDETEIINF